MSNLSKQYYWSKSLEISKDALILKTLCPIKTKLTHINVNNNIIFDIRSIDTNQFKFESIIGPLKNPFLPWDKTLEISKINSSHTLILNKYPVQIGHMLLITKEWKPQNGWLDLLDIQALKKVENDTYGLWFFNSCYDSGASQTHRHIQLLPREDINNICPLQSWYKNDDHSEICTSNILAKSIHTIQRKRHKESASDLYNIYKELSLKIGNDIAATPDKPLYPYNLLIGPDWITIIKRKKEFAFGFSLNALAFAGYILCTSKSDLKWLKENGPLKLLESVI